MTQKNYLTLGDEFIKYCELNKIEDPEILAKKIFQNGFNLIKYGDAPPGFKVGEKVIEKEIIKEVIKEVPVEKIIEVVKEVPIEKIVYVTNQEEIDLKIFQQKQEYEEECKKFSTITEELENIFQKELNKKNEEITTLKQSIDNLSSDKDTEVSALIEENKKLKEELNSLTKSLEGLGRKGKFMKDSNLSSLYDE